MVLKLLRGFKISPKWSKIVKIAKFNLRYASKTKKNQTQKSYVQLLRWSSALWTEKNPNKCSPPPGCETKDFSSWNIYCLCWFANQKFGMCKKKIQLIFFTSGHREWTGWFLWYFQLCYSCLTSFVIYTATGL